eukprot:3706465-Amphidinium_carterae.1
MRPANAVIPQQIPVSASQAPVRLQTVHTPVHWKSIAQVTPVRSLSVFLRNLSHYWRDLPGTSGKMNYLLSLTAMPELFRHTRQGLW